MCDKTYFRPPLPSTNLSGFVYGTAEDDDDGEDSDDDNYNYDESDGEDELDGSKDNATVVSADLVNSLNSIPTPGSEKRATEPFVSDCNQQNGEIIESVKNKEQNTIPLDNKASNDKIHKLLGEPSLFSQLVKAKRAAEAKQKEEKASSVPNLSTMGNEYPATDRAVVNASNMHVSVNGTESQENFIQTTRIKHEVDQQASQKITSSYHDSEVDNAHLFKKAVFTAKSTQSQGNPLVASAQESLIPEHPHQFGQTLETSSIQAATLSSAVANEKGLTTSNVSNVPDNIPPSTPHISGQENIAAAKASLKLQHIESNLNPATDKNDGTKIVSTGTDTPMSADSVDEHLDPPNGFFHHDKSTPSKLVSSDNSLPRNSFEVPSDCLSENETEEVCNGVSTLWMEKALSGKNKSHKRVQPPDSETNYKDLAHRNERKSSKSNRRISIDHSEKHWPAPQHQLDISHIYRDARVCGQLQKSTFRKPHLLSDIAELYKHVCHCHERNCGGHRDPRIRHEDATIAGCSGKAADVTESIGSNSMINRDITSSDKGHDRHRVSSIDDTTLISAAAETTGGNSVYNKHQKNTQETTSMTDDVPEPQKRTCKSVNDVVQEAQILGTINRISKLLHRRDSQKDVHETTGIPGKLVLPESEKDTSASLRNMTEEGQSLTLVNRSSKVVHRRNSQKNTEELVLGNLEKETESSKVLHRRASQKDAQEAPNKLQQTVLMVPEQDLSVPVRDKVEETRGLGAISRTVDERSRSSKETENCKVRPTRRGSQSTQETSSLPENILSAPTRNPSKSENDIIEESQSLNLGTGKNIEGEKSSNESSELPHRRESQDGTQEKEEGTSMPENVLPAPVKYPSKRNSCDTDEKTQILGLSNKSVDEKSLYETESESSNLPPRRESEKDTQKTLNILQQVTEPVAADTSKLPSAMDERTQGLGLSNVDDKSSTGSKTEKSKLPRRRKSKKDAQETTDMLEPEKHPSVRINNMAEKSQALDLNNRIMDEETSRSEADSSKLLDRREEDRTAGVKSPCGMTGGALMNTEESGKHGSVCEIDGKTVPDDKKDGNKQCSIHSDGSVTRVPHVQEKVLTHVQVYDSSEDASSDQALTKEGSVIPEDRKRLNLPSAGNEPKHKHEEHSDTKSEIFNANEMKKSGILSAAENVYKNQNRSVISDNTDLEKEKMKIRTGQFKRAVSVSGAKSFGKLTVRQFRRPLNSEVLDSSPSPVKKKLTDSWDKNTDEETHRRTDGKISDTDSETAVSLKAKRKLFDAKSNVSKDKGMESVVPAKKKRKIVTQHVKTCAKERACNISLCCDCILDPKKHKAGEQKENKCQSCSRHLKRKRCVKCRLEFPNKLAVYSHTINDAAKFAKTDKVKYSCMHCDTAFQSRISFYRHAAFSNCSAFCVKCEAFFKSNAAKCGHTCKNVKQQPEETDESSSTEIPSFQCYICKTERKNLQGLEMHMEEHSSASRSFVCTKCGASFYVRLSFERHLTLHKLEKRDKPTETQKLVSNDDKIDQHTIELQCFRCKTQFPSRYELIKHIEERKIKSCAPPIQKQDVKCKDNAKNLGNTDIERQTEQQNHNGSMNTAECEPHDLQCFRCKTQFSSRMELSKHIEDRKVKSCESLVEKKDSVVHFPTPIPTVQCFKCKKLFKNLESVQIHIDKLSACRTSRSSKYGEAELKCFECNVYFHSRLELSRHIEARKTQGCAVALTNSMPIIQCLTCTQKFTNIESLKVHVQKLTCSKQDKIFRCFNCDMEFHSYRHLHKHILARKAGRSCALSEFDEQYTSGKMYEDDDLTYDSLDTDELKPQITRRGYVGELTDEDEPQTDPRGQENSITESVHKQISSIRTQGTQQVGPSLERTDQSDSSKIRESSDISDVPKSLNKISVKNEASGDSQMLDNRQRKDDIERTRDRRRSDSYEGEGANMKRPSSEERVGDFGDRNFLSVKWEDGSMMNHVQYGERNQSFKSPSKKRKASIGTRALEDSTRPSKCSAKELSYDENHNRSCSGTNRSEGQQNEDCYIESSSLKTEKTGSKLVTKAEIPLETDNVQDSSHSPKSENDDPVNTMPNDTTNSNVSKMKSISIDLPGEPESITMNGHNGLATMQSPIAGEQNRSPEDEYGRQSPVPQSPRFTRPLDDEYRKQSPLKSPRFRDRLFDNESRRELGWAGSRMLDTSPTFQARRDLPEELQKYKCVKCMWQGTSWYNLDDHLVRDHAMIKKLVCRFVGCKKTFVLGKSLAIHMTVHEPTKAKDSLDDGAYHRDFRDRYRRPGDYQRVADLRLPRNGPRGRGVNHSYARLSTLDKLRKRYESYESSPSPVGDRFRTDRSWKPVKSRRSKNYDIRLSRSCDDLW